MATWKLAEQIDKGGQCPVFAVSRDEDENYVFALKRLPDDASEESTNRFIREARILAKLDHPNIVKVVAKRLSEAPFFFVMPRYDHSLADELPDIQGNPDRCVAIFSALLDAIEYAHTEGVLHRDLKPLNVLLNGETDVAVCDFGFGRDLESDSTRDTYLGQGFGSQLYAPPEQYRGAREVDERADIFSLGMILYAMYSGGPPTHIDPATVPSQVALVVLKCVSPDPDKRYQSVTDLKAAWTRFNQADSHKSLSEELVELTAKLTSPADTSESQVARLLYLLASLQTDPDQVFEAIATVDPVVIAEMYRTDPYSTRHLVSIFLDQTASQSWPFSYTDTLANQCDRIHRSIEDAALRAKIIKTTLELGVAHNRWHVLSIFQSLMRIVKLPGELVYLYNELDGVEVRRRKAAAQYLEKVKLDELIKPLFEFPAEQESEDW